MKKAFIFLATGFEEIEAITIIDILRRGDIDVQIVSIENDLNVKGAHQIEVTANSKFNDTDFSIGNILILPGGLPGATNLLDYKPLLNLINEYNSLGKYISAICAAPMVFGKMGLLKDKKAICYPGFEQYLEGAIITNEKVVVDSNIITSRGPATASDFGFKLLEILKDKNTSIALAQGMLFI